MTREEGLERDKALIEISDAIKKLPTLKTTFGGAELHPEMVSKEKVLAIIWHYLP